MMKVAFLVIAGIAAVTILTVSILSVLFPKSQVTSQAQAQVKLKSSLQPSPVRKTYPIVYDIPPKKPLTVTYVTPSVKPPHKRVVIIKPTPTVTATPVETFSPSYVAPTPSDTPTPVPTQTPSFGAAAKAIAFAVAQIGCPYVYGGTGPCDSGYDCSGLAKAAWEYAGITIPRTSYEQWDSLTRVSLSSIEPGDILVFSDASHVGLFLGNGYMIDASHSGVPVEKVPLAGYYLNNLIGAVRP